MQPEQIMLVPALAATLTLFGGPPAQAQENVLRWSSQAGIANLDPHGTTGALPLSVMGNVYEPLVGRDADMQLEPVLATEWEVVNPTTWRFKLREGVTFHNGNPFTVDDVIFSMNRVGNDYSFLRGLRRETVRESDKMRSPARHAMIGARWRSF
jgi:peptide/nickel transport system substrate-binding protein